MKAFDFTAVRSAAAALPDVEESTSWGAPALKVRGQMFVCQAINKQAEPNTLVVRMDLAQRDALIEEDPAVYYLKEHYVDYPCVLSSGCRVCIPTPCAISCRPRIDSSAQSDRSAARPNALQRTARHAGAAPRNRDSSPPRATSLSWSTRYSIARENYKKERETVTGNYTDVLVKEGGRWLFIAWAGGDDPKK